MKPTSRRLRSTSYPVTDRPTASPQITGSSWGELVAEGLDRARDLKLWPGGGRHWDWAETGTHHVPGIQPSDVEELLDNGSAVIVLSRGRELQLQTSPQTVEMLTVRGVVFHIEETEAAVRLYNGFAREGIPVGGLFHSTC